jgi:hypothetical protein
MRNSGRGGARTGGGRKSEWRNQPTVSIRVPQILAQQILEIARELDKGYEGTITINTASGKLSQQRKATQDRLYLSDVRIYRATGHKVVRLEELVRSLQRYIDLEN